MSAARVAPAMNVAGARKSAFSGKPIVSRAASLKAPRRAATFTVRAADAAPAKTEKKEEEKPWSPPKLNPNTPSPIFGGSTGGLLRKAQVRHKHGRDKRGESIWWFFIASRVGFQSRDDVDDPFDALIAFATPRVVFLITQFVALIGFKRERDAACPLRDRHRAPTAFAGNDDRGRGEEKQNGVNSRVCFFGLDTTRRLRIPDRQGNATEAMTLTFPPQLTTTRLRSSTC